MTQAQLARRLHFDMGMLSRIIPRLMDAGVVMRGGFKGEAQQRD
jgi:hypothetical protein